MSARILATSTTFCSATFGETEAGSRFQKSGGEGAVEFGTRGASQQPDRESRVGDVARPGVLCGHAGIVQQVEAAEGVAVAGGRIAANDVADRIERRGDAPIDIVLNNVIGDRVVI